MNTLVPTYSRLEDQLSVGSHILGVVLGIVGTFILLFIAIGQKDGWQIASAAIYGVSLITLFSASSAYHYIQEPRLRALMQRFDHIAILYLIAGTFTPFALVTLQTAWGWTIFSFVWFCAIVGTVIHLTELRRFHLAMVVLNLIMGWSALLLISPLMTSISPSGLALLILGGLIYTLGLVFYLNDDMPMNHFIWHLFVLMGAMCHYLTIALFVF